MRVVGTSEMSMDRVRQQLQRVRELTRRPFGPI
jgi:hypothetical protein